MKFILRYPINEYRTWSDANNIASEMIPELDEFSYILEDEGLDVNIVPNMQNDNNKDNCPCLNIKLHIGVLPKKNLSLLDIIKDESYFHEYLDRIKEIYEPHGLDIRFRTPKGATTGLSYLTDLFILLVWKPMPPFSYGP